MSSGYAFLADNFDQGSHNPQNIATFLFVFSLSILFLLYDPVLIRVGGLNLLVLIVLVMTNSCVFDNYHIIIYYSAHVLYKLQSVKMSKVLQVIEISEIWICHIFEFSGHQI